MSDKTSYLDIQRPDGTAGVSFGPDGALLNGSPFSGSVTTPGSSTADDFVQFSNTGGAAFKDGGLSLSTNTALGTSDTKIPSQKAVKTYADTKVATTKLTDGTIQIILPNADPHVAGVLWNNAGTVTVSAG